MKLTLTAVLSLIGFVSPFAHAETSENAKAGGDGGFLEQHGTGNLAKDAPVVYGVTEGAKRRVSLRASRPASQTAAELPAPEKKSDEVGFSVKKKTLGQGAGAVVGGVLGAAGGAYAGGSLVYLCGVAVGGAMGTAAAIGFLGLIALGVVVGGMVGAGVGAVAGEHIGGSLAK